MKHTPKVFDAISFAILLAVVLFSLMPIIVTPGCTSGGGGPSDWAGNNDCLDADRDGDGYYTERSCGNTLDCDDTDSTIHPGATEHCVGIDNDCDGVIDDGCVPEICGDGVDNDGDGVIDEECRSGSSFISDTGQTRCYDDNGAIHPCPSPGQDFYGQDACYSSISSSFIKLDSSGNTLPGGSLSWAMVKDNVSGLIWEVKSDDDGLNDKDNIYNWADAAGVFIAQLNAGNFGGYSDWRLPTIVDMTSLVDYNVYGPAIDVSYFPNTKSDYYWCAGPEDAAWVFDFYDGSLFGVDKQTQCCVRAVRGAVSWPTFTDNGDGTVTATANGKSLMWMKDSSADISTWMDALAYCENLTLAGYSDWRLPNIKELRSIVDYGRSQPAINPNCFPNTNSGPYWSSTTDASHKSDAWQVGFYSGGSQGGDKIYYYWDAFVRAVRGGQ